MKKQFLILVLLSVCVSACMDNLQSEAKFMSSKSAFQKSSLSVIPDSLFDLENASIGISKHYRGHRASFSEGCDAYSTTPTTGHAYGGEMLSFKYNMGTTVFTSGVNQAEKDTYHTGRVDFGVYHNSSNYASTDVLVTGLRDNVPASAGAYSSGVTTYKNSLLPIFLSSRNSAYDSSLIQYTGLSDLDMISRGLCFRQEYYSDLVAPNPDFQYGSEADGVAILAQLVPRVINKGGWYRCFTHWLRWSGDYSKRYFSRLDSLITLHGGDVYFGSFNRITEYYWAKEAVDSVKASGKTVTIYYHKDYPSSPYDRITTPVWVRLDLSGTVYAGKDIVTSNGGKIRSMGNDLYYVACTLDFSQSSVSFDVVDTTTPTYINLVKPVVTRSGTVITSDQPVRCAVFFKPKTDPLEMDVNILQRFTTPGTSFTITKTLNTTTNDYYIGFINDEGISGVTQF